MARPRSVSEALTKLGMEGAEGEGAFEYLYEDGNPLLRKYLVGKGARLQDAEDIPQQIFLSILKKRLGLKFESEGEWYAYIHVAARNKLYGLRPLDPRLTEWEKAGLRTVDKIIDVILRDGLYEFADDLWLGAKVEDFYARSLAAKLLIEDGQPPEEILPLIALYGDKTTPASEDQLWRWLNDLRVLRQIAFDILNLSNDQLAAHLLQVRCEDLDDVRDEAVSGCLGSTFNLPWTAVEVGVILIRYRHGISLALAGDHCKPKRETVQVFNICARCLGLFPFEGKMVDLWNRTEACPLRKKAFGENPLWKRLSFQFTHINGLVQDDVIERLAPAAAVAGHPLKHINTWVAERFENDLVKYAKKMKAGR